MAICDAFYVTIFLFSWQSGEHHWPNSTNVEKTDLQSSRLLCYLFESRNINFHCIENIYLFFKKRHLFVQFLGAGIVEETTYRRTGKELTCILCYGRPTSTSMQIADHADACSEQANCFICIQLNTQLICPSILNENMPKFKIVRS